MKKLFILFIFCSLSKNVYSTSITGVQLKEKIANWLESKGSQTNIEILDNIKYTICSDQNLLISDISGNFRLIKVSCVGENKWSFIIRNKQNLKVEKNNSKKKKFYKKFKFFRTFDYGSFKFDTR